MILMIKHFGQVYVDQTLKQNPKKKKKRASKVYLIKANLIR